MTWLLFTASADELDGWLTKEEIFKILLDFFDAHYRPRLRGKYRKQILQVKDELTKSNTEKSCNILQRIHDVRLPPTTICIRAILSLLRICCSMRDLINAQDRDYSINEEDDAALVSYLRKSFTPPARTNWRTL